MEFPEDPAGLGTNLWAQCANPPARVDSNIQSLCFMAAAIVRDGCRAAVSGQICASVKDFCFAASFASEVLGLEAGVDEACYTTSLLWHGSETCEALPERWTLKRYGISEENHDCGYVMGNGAVNSAWSSNTACSGFTCRLDATVSVAARADRPGGTWRLDVQAWLWDIERDRIMTGSTRTGSCEFTAQPILYQGCAVTLVSADDRTVGSSARILGRTSWSLTWLDPLGGPHHQYSGETCEVVISYRSYEHCS